MREAVLGGAENLAAIEAKAEAALNEAGFVPDYAVIRRADDLGSPADGDSVPLIALVAARGGSTRLIDNLLLTP